MTILTMRNSEQISQIKSRITDPYSVEDFITQQDITHLISIFYKEKNKIYKNTGPITLNIVPFLNDSVFIKIMDKLKIEIGSFKMTAGMFFSTDFPHIVHNDDTFELPDGVYKGITLPLEISRSSGTDLPNLCLFDQFYFHGPAKFFNGDADVPTYYNKQVYEYTAVDGISDTASIDESVRLKYLTHLNPKWLTGLTLWGTLKWKPTSALIFDSVRLHCSSDFRKQGIERKLGISIFTKVL